MLVKLIYILLFAAFNFVIYSKLNKTGKLRPTCFGSLSQYLLSF
jgi:hypothetical protein